MNSSVRSIPFPVLWPALLQRGVRTESQFMPFIGIFQPSVSFDDDSRLVIHYISERNRESFAMRNYKKATGFTLIELMVTVAIIGILAAVAMPAYTDYVTRGKIPDATSALAAKRVRMEQYFQDNRKYDGAPECANDTATSKYFTFSCDPAATATTYTLKAVGRESMTGFTFTVDESNKKTTTITGVSGWTAHSPNDCWVTKKGGQC